MLIRKLANYLQSRDDYVIINGPIRMPRIIKKEIGHYKLVGDWNQSLYITGRQGNEIAFGENLRNNFIKWGIPFNEPIPQVVFPITDRDLWNSVCPSNIKDRRGRYYKFTNYYIADYFLESGTIVELDYDSTHCGIDQLLYDKAKDEYSRIKYGFETKRLKGYGTSLEGNLNGDALIAELTMKQSKVVIPRYPDYTEAFMATAAKEFKNEITLLKLFPGDIQKKILSGDLSSITPEHIINFSRVHRIKIDLGRMEIVLREGVMKGPLNPYI